MAWRQCECVLQLPDGRKYSAVVTAPSVYQAALMFQEYCNNGDPTFKRPRITEDSKLEVKPIYRVEMKKVLAYANWAESREGKKARQQR
jgi:formylglycine-generating enzyme required for sulfatase activity